MLLWIRKYTCVDFAKEIIPVLTTVNLKLCQNSCKNPNIGSTCSIIWMKFQITISCFSRIGYELFLFYLFNSVKWHKNELCMPNEEQLRRSGTKHFCRNNTNFRYVSAEIVAKPQMVSVRFSFYFGYSWRNLD